MAAIAKTTTGNENASIPKPPEPKWVSLDEAAKLDRLRGRRYVPKDDAAFAKKFFYEIVSVIPTQPVGTFSPSDNIYYFLVQKYHRHQTMTVTAIDGSGNSADVEKAKKVDGHVMNENGVWLCVDKYASFMMDSAKFLADHEIDKSE